MSNDKKIPSLEIGNLKVKKAIIQGGMGVGISLSGLAAAVANEGGIGVIATVGNGIDEADFKKNPMEANFRALRKEIRNARSLTNGVLGVNIMMALTDVDELVKVSVEEKVDIIIMGAGLLSRLPSSITLDELKESNAKIAPIVSSGKAAKLIFRSWDRRYEYVPDAVIVEGPKAGGHLGFKYEDIFSPEHKLEKLVVDVIEELKFFEEKYNKKIPVIAAGGIYDGKDISEIFKLGVAGVQLGTRFVATHESDASDEFKNAYVKCKEEDIEIIKSPVGLPGRAITTKFLKAVESGERHPVSCPWKCLRTCDYKTTPYCIAVALLNAKRGRVDAGFAFCGSNAYKIDKIISVKELFNELEDGYLNS